MDKAITHYQSQNWLNKNTPSTGAIVCYDGTIKSPDGDWESQFIEISDCHNKIRLHRGTYDSAADWLAKVGELKHVITEYFDFLCENYKDLDKRCSGAKDTTE